MMLEGRLRCINSLRLRRHELIVASALNFGAHECLHATSQKHALSHAISLAMNYRLFSHGDVSYRFNGKNDNVVLELSVHALSRCIVFHHLWTSSLTISLSLFFGLNSASEHLASASNSLSLLLQAMSSLCNIILSLTSAGTICFYSKFSIYLLLS